ncbi:MAG: hypothetical protein R3B90_13345 [Planctomycetaceae bacterium]
MQPQAADSARLQRCTELEYLLLGDLREMLEEPITPQGAKWILAVVEALLDALPREHRMKSVDGYLSEVLQEFPNWNRRVRQLESQYFEMYDKLAELRDELEDGRTELFTTQSVVVGLTEWMQLFTNLQRHESDLLLEAVNTEIGGSG